MRCLGRLGRAAKGSDHARTDEFLMQCRVVACDVIPDLSRPRLRSLPFGERLRDPRARYEFQSWIRVVFFFLPCRSQLCRQATLGRVLGQVGTWNEPGISGAQTSIKQPFNPRRSIAAADLSDRLHNDTEEPVLSAHNNKSLFVWRGWASRLP